MKYLLDTDTLIDFIQDTGQARARIVTMLEEGDELALCAGRTPHAGSMAEFPKTTPVAQSDQHLDQ